MKITKKVTYVLGASALACLLAGAATLSIRTAAAAADEPTVEKELGGGAPTKVLEDNDTVKVTLVTYPANFKRNGGQRRRMEQVIVYVDDGDFQIIRPSDAKARTPSAVTPGQRGPESSITPDGGLAKNGFHPAGTVAWHPKDSITPSLVTRRAYRAMFIELKK